MVVHRVWMCIIPYFWLFWWNVRSSCLVPGDGGAGRPVASLASLISSKKNPDLTAVLDSKLLGNMTNGGLIFFSSLPPTPFSFPPSLPAGPVPPSPLLRLGPDTHTHKHLLGWRNTTALGAAARWLALHEWKNTNTLWVLLRLLFMLFIIVQCVYVNICFVSMHIYILMFHVYIHKFLNCLNMSASLQCFKLVIYSL